MIPNGQSDQLWSVEEVGHYLRMPISSIYKMTGPKARLKIPHVRIAGRLRFRKPEIDRWLEVLSVSNVDTLIKAAQAVARRARDHGVHPS
jgi:hypothetical protein